MRVDTKKILEELAQYLGDNDIMIIKSAPVAGESHSNKIVISIHDKLDSRVEYEFDEDVTTDKILEEDYHTL